MVRLREALAWMRDGISSPSNRGLAFWLVTILLGLLLPAPVAVAVVVARLRGGARRASGSPGARLGSGALSAAGGMPGDGPRDAYVCKPR